MKRSCRVFIRRNNKEKYYEWKHKDLYFLKQHIEHLRDCTDIEKLEIKILIKMEEEKLK